MAAVTYRSVRPAVPIARHEPHHVEGRLPDVFELEARTYTHSPDAGLFVARGGFSELAGQCRNGYGGWIPWNASALPAGRNEGAARWDPRVLVRTAARHRDVVSLAHPQQRGYFHWLFDVLPRMSLLDGAGTCPAAVYLDQSQAFQRETWQMLRPPCETIDAAAEPRIHATTLTVPTAVSTSGVPPAWVCKWLRERFRVPATDAPRVRIYVSRAGVARGRVVNEARLEPLLDHYGFTSVRTESMSVAEQIRLFSSAEAVAGAHGAGLSNAVFAPADCKVVELFAPGYVNVCYWTLCCQLGLHYSMLLGEDAPGSTGLRPDIVIDESKLRRLLAQVFGTASTGEPKASAWAH
jgi:hypothetical protein